MVQRSTGVVLVVQSSTGVVCCSTGVVLCSAEQYRSSTL